MAKFCGKCGSNIENATKFCPHCGQSLKPASAPEEKKPVTQQVQQEQQEQQPQREQQVQQPQQAAPVANEVPKDLNAEKREAQKAKKENAVAETKAEKPAETEAKVGDKDTKKAKKKEERKAKKKKNRFLRVVAILLCFFILIGGISGALAYFDIMEVPVVSQIVDLFIKNTSEEAYATEIINAFKNKDMARINDIVFYEDTYKIDDNIGVDFNDGFETESNEEGVLNAIFSRTKLSYVGVKENQFIYEVEGPNMKEVFHSALDIQTQEELLKYIYEFVENAELIKTNVAVSFSKSNEEITAEYKTAEFINAITGGLVDAYKDIYNQYIEDIISGEAGE